MSGRSVTRVRAARAALAALAALVLAASSALVPAGAAARADAPKVPKVPKVPANFLWGVATSGFQSEGYFPDSNWTRYVAQKRPGVTDPYKNSVDFRHRYPEDIARARALGVKVFRTSIEWARIEPKRGHRDPAALAYYDDLVRRVRAAGMRPMLTLDHWVYPGWVAAQGGWKNPRTAKDWLDEARFVVERYRRMGVIWITFNEASFYLFREFADAPLTLPQALAMKNALVRTHRAAYDLIHRIDPGAMVSSNIAYGTILNGLFDGVLFNQVTDKLDFIGIDYYYGASVTNVTALNVASGEPWKAVPEPDGLYYVLRSYQRRLPKLPLYVVENGFATDNGKPHPDGYTRSQHLRDHIYWLQRAIGDGVKVIGYNYWSLTDNYEWGSYRPRFGLYTVDALTDPKLTRRPTDAVPAYRQIIASRGVPSGYIPVRKPAWCTVEDLTTCLAPPKTPPAQ
ncbi:glycoside hydrolase family 1 protein [Actinomadura rupiterrae]|uniref:glycoside hydrolase family 1 protein n=1 Tax=Actinomadura rupiterrae TaxID=559627 RepID=UPI0020A5499C|nr:family 1 glycosylhydrolase [Actinomadura rupiterrae]